MPGNRLVRKFDSIDQNPLKKPLKKIQIPVSTSVAASQEDNTPQYQPTWVSGQETHLFYCSSIAGLLIKAYRGTQEVRLQFIFIYSGLRPPGFSRPQPRGCLPCLGCLCGTESQVFQVEIFPRSKHQAWPSQENNHTYH